MVSTDWETEDGSTVTNYKLVEGRASSTYCLQPVSGETPTFKPVGSEYINKHELTVQYSFKNDVAFYFEYKDSDNYCEFKSVSGVNTFKIKVATVEEQSETITLDVDNYGWYTVKIDYKYSDSTATNWLRVSYLNSSAEWVETILIVLEEDLVYLVGDNRKMFFQLDENSAQLDDISIGV